MAKIEKEEIITSYKGNVLFRLLSYLKSYKTNVAVISVLCLLLTTIDLVRPMFISTGIDTFINGYQKTYVKVQQSNLQFKGDYLSDKLNADIGYILTGRKHYHIELPQGTTRDDARLRTSAPPRHNAGDGAPLHRPCGRDGDSVSPYGRARYGGSLRPRHHRAVLPDTLHGTKPYRPRVRVRDSGKGRKLIPLSIPRND